MPTKVLRRRLLGFKPQHVHELLAERDYAVGRALERADALERELTDARERLKAAEASAQEMQARATTAEDRLQNLEGELAASRLKPAPPFAGNVDPNDPILGLLVQGLAPIIDTARESAAAVIEEATKISERRVGEAEGAMRLLLEQGRTMATWWTGVQSVVQPMMSTLDHARSRMQEVPARVEQALAPLADLMGAVQDQLGELARVSEPPAVAAPKQDTEMVVDLTQTEGPSEPTSRSPERDPGAGTAWGLRRGSHSWWPEVSPSASSAGL